MRSISDWLLRGLEGWLRTKGVIGSERRTLGHPTPSTSLPVRDSLPVDMLLRWFFDCGRELLLRDRHPQAVACLLDALRLDSARALDVVKHMTGEGAGMAAACLQLCATIAQAAEHGVNLAWGSPPEPSAMRKISVVICSIDEERFAAVSASYARALAAGPYEIIRIADARSLAEGYNRGLDQSSGDIVIFSHDDVRILSPVFRAELTAALEANDLVGVAGATRLVGPQWTACPPEERRQLVCYPPTAETTECICSIDGSGDDRWYNGIQCLDGLFIAARRQVLSSLRFDANRYDGFHFYDLDLSYRAFRAGLRLAVCPRLGLMHHSAGNYDDPEWQRYARVFCEQYDLPMAFRPPTPAMTFASEAELVTFLAARFAWQDARSSNIAPEGSNAVRLGQDRGEAANAPQKVLLHVGCGSHRREHTGPGFQSALWREIRLDADPTVKPDLIGSITDLSAVPSCSVDAVFSSHTLEHLYAHEVPVALAEIRRVLRDTGVAVAWVPDLQAAARLIAEDRLYETIGVSPYGPLTPFDIVFSHRGAVGRDRPFMAHHCGFTLSTLVAAHRDAGFRSVVARPRIPGFDLQVLATPALIPTGLLAALASLHFQD